jgi:hypothetical protein
MPHTCAASAAAAATASKAHEAQYGNEKYDNDSSNGGDSCKWNEHIVVHALPRARTGLCVDVDKARSRVAEARASHSIAIVFMTSTDPLIPRADVPVQVAALALEVAQERLLTWKSQRRHIVRRGCKKHQSE